jgi:hypothetical protein
VANPATKPIVSDVCTKRGWAPSAVLCSQTFTKHPPHHLTFCLPLSRSSSYCTILYIIIREPSAPPNNPRRTTSTQHSPAPSLVDFCLLFLVSQVGPILLTRLIMSYPPYNISQYSPSHSSSFSSSSSSGSPSNYGMGRKSPFFLLS